jgi:diguanylate cyclase (GGDEF)-like protein
VNAKDDGTPCALRVGEAEEVMSDATPDKASQGEGQDPSHRGRILVVDDSRVVRAMVGGYLRQAGYHVDEAEDGTIAIGGHLIKDYDVVVTDLRMPRVDGFGLLEEVKRLELGPEVVILTGSHAQDMQCAVRALRLGAHDFLTKPPAGPDEVVLAVARAVEKKRLRETNARLLRELQALSRTDGLTGAGNRRAFDEALRQETSRAERYRLPLSVVMIDVDHFKSVNDRFGHRMGDEVLKAVTRAVASELRETDATYRYGGEEFAILLPHTGAEGALEVGARLVAAMASRPVNVGAVSLKVTISAGVSSASGAELSENDIVAQADAALYAAKRAGRNQVRAHGNVGRRPGHVALAAAC